MNARIRIRQPDPEAYRTLIAAGTEPLLARLCAARNVKSANELGDQLQQLLPYHSLKNIAPAAERLARAVLQQEKIIIAADYDADGATACAVGLLGLSALGARVDFVVPNRFEHGYGLSPQLAETAAQSGARLLLTVDNGIASVAGVARAQALGLTVIVTDHHLPGDALPDCLIVNPNQDGCPFPSKSLAGVGVMFYVLLALRAHLRSLGHFDRHPEPNLADLLDLVALGTVADVVGLDHNNRILVAQGIKRMRAGKMRPGIRALFEAAKRDWRKAQPFDLGFAVGPRLNAAGRLDDMSLGIACLISTDEDEARRLAAELDGLNRERRQIEHSMLDEALAGLEHIGAQDYSVVAYRDDWHQGVVGIVASRLRERFHRPCIVFAPADNGELRGSGRSIPALHLRDALDLVSKRAPGVILKFGGHAMAAGLSIRTEQLPAFQAAFEAVVSECLNAEDLIGCFVTDGPLGSDELSLEHAQQLADQVWGQGFTPPSFTDEFTVLWQKPVGSGHTKAALHRDGRTVEALFFRCDAALPERIRTVYRPVANEWRNRLELQLYVDYWENAAALPCSTP